MGQTSKPYPPIGDYGIISDCHGVALVSRTGSMDWCCLPRIDDDSCFGRLLDWNKGGFCSITPADAAYTATRRYLPGTMILETRFCTQEGVAIVLDFFAMDAGPPQCHGFGLIRMIESVSGEMAFQIDIQARFDYGEIIPRVQQHQNGVHTVIGSNKGLLINCDIPLDVLENRNLNARVRAHGGQRIRLAMQFQPPERLEEPGNRARIEPSHIDSLLERTRAWWIDWSEHIRTPFAPEMQTLRSAITLKALTFERTGAVAAAATTSLPEQIGGGRNWDYRFSWVRDSAFTVRVLRQLGYVREAERFRQFTERSSAGSADELQIMYGVDGKRRLTEVELDWLEGYRQSKPVRIGNKAAKQIQFDIYGELLEMTWESHAAGHPVNPDYWRFLVDVLDAICERWQEPDHGIWEMRSEAAHHVYSKVMCWAALNRGVMLAQQGGLDGRVEHWIRQRDDLRQLIEHKGIDPERGIFTQAFGSRRMDASLLLLPRAGFVAYDDPRMVRTVDAICQELDCQGLLLRYNSPDGLPGQEGAFLPCTFWLVACLAHQGRHAQAWQYYERALRCANDIGLFSEEFDVHTGEMLGNFPQGLTHVSQIMARLALADADADVD